MLQITYGNFLRRSEQKKARYEYNRPLGLLVSECILIIALSSFLVGALTLGFLYLNKPVRSHDVATYETALRETNNLAKSIAVYKEARPNGIDVCSIIETFVKERNDDIDFRKLSITPKKYILTAWTRNMGAANDFTKQLAFGDGKTTQISTVKVVDDTTEFLVTVMDKEDKAAKGGR